MLSRKPKKDFVLNRRERNILSLVAAGRSTDEIARELTVSGKTVEKNLNNLMTKCDLSELSPVVFHALEQGVINLYEVLEWSFLRRKS